MANLWHRRQVLLPLRYWQASVIKVLSTGMSETRRTSVILEFHTKVWWLDLHFVFENSRFMWRIVLLRVYVTPNTIFLSFFCGSMSRRNIIWVVIRINVKVINLRRVKFQSKRYQMTSFRIQYSQPHDIGKVLLNVRENFEIFIKILTSSLMVAKYVTVSTLWTGSLPTAEKC
jgi:hypothetical protein